MLSRSGERLCARKNLSPSLTLKSELEAIHIGRSNLLSSAASRYVLFLNVDGMDGIPLNRRRPLTKIRQKHFRSSRKEEIYIPLWYGRERLSLLFLQLSQKLHFPNTQSRLSVIERMHIEGVKKRVEKEVSHSISKPSNPPVLG